MAVAEGRREALLEQETDARLTWDAAVASIPPALRSDPVLPMDRSVKDLVAHMAAWERWCVDRLAAQRDGRPVEPIPEWHPYEHAFNERVYARWRDVPWDDVAAEAAAAYAAFRATVESLDDELLAKRETLIAACGSAHYREYVEQIRAILQTLPPRTSFETERLRLRSFLPSDAPFLLEIFGDPEVTRYIPPSPPITLERARRAADRRTASEHKNGFALWMVERKDTGEPIGNCGFALVENRGPDVEIAYHYVRSAWNKGYGTEAAIACLARGFETNGFDRVFAFCYPENVGSWRVMEKAGMRDDGMTEYLGIRMKRYVADRGTWRAPGS